MSFKHLRLTVTLAAALAAGNLARAQSVTKIIDNGPDSGRKIVAVLGDGYAAADQARWVSDVNRLVLNGVFKNDFFAETHNAFNVYRVNLVSSDSGVTRRYYDENGTPNDPRDDRIIRQVWKNTALNYIYSGSWAHCWLEGGPATRILVRNALRRNVPNYDFVIIILNEDGGGGCGGGGFSVITRSVGWPIVGHEMGHGIGGLRDEYSKPGTYAGSSLNGPNVSTVLDRNRVAWKRFISPSTPIPTTFTSGMDPARTVGMFEGALYAQRGIYRPVHNGRMKGNTPDFSPVGYTHMKKRLHAATGQDFSRAVTGDFTGDRRSDILFNYGHDIGIYKTRPSPLGLERLWFGNNVIPAAPGGNTWEPRANDQYAVGDFDNDGRDDVYVFNGVDWAVPYLGMLRSTGSALECTARYDTSIPSVWTMKPHDRIMTGDFNGDGKDDLAIINGQDWSVAYLGVLRSDGRRLLGVQTYARSVSNWTMKPNDHYAVGDFDGDGKDDIYVFNGLDWSSPYLAMLRSVGTGLTEVKKYQNTLPGWTMAKHDQLLVGDLNADGRDDLYVVNNQDWSVIYLMMLRSTGSALAAVRRYSGATNESMPGWSMKKGDRYFVADVNRDRRADLFVQNTIDWASDYLGTLRSTGSGLTGTWKAGSVGSWRLGYGDLIEVAGYDGTGFPNGLFIRNASRLALLRHPSPTASLTSDNYYYGWINTALYDADPEDNGSP
jgi:hypothetical protein